MISAERRMIQGLNNKACVLLETGEFAEANRLLGMALEKHKREVEGYTSTNYDIRHMTSVDKDDYYLEDIDKSYSSDSYESDYEDEDDDMDTCSNDTLDTCPREQQEKEKTGFATSKMITCTQVCNLPHAGQQESTSSQRSYHKIYGLAIVMDDDEWDSASPDDKSFVLVFNSALSNHLWGMKLLSLMGRDCNTSPFETAKALYLLALETLWNTGNSAGFNGGRIRSVDKLCVPAIFNNLSHCSKVLNGYGSQESSVYDSILLKSVFWWIDGNSSVYTASSSSLNSPDLRRTSDGDTEIVEAFLDTVFYLIGAPQSTAPAAAA